MAGKQTQSNIEWEVYVEICVGGAVGQKEKKTSQRKCNERESESARGVETHLDNSSVAYWGHESLQPHTHHFLYAHQCHWLLQAPSMLTVSINPLLLFCHTHTAAAACPKRQTLLSKPSGQIMGWNRWEQSALFVLCIFCADIGNSAPGSSGWSECSKMFQTSFVSIVVNIQNHTFSTTLCHVQLLFTPSYSCSNTGNHTRNIYFLCYFDLPHYQPEHFSFVSRFLTSLLHIWKQPFCHLDAGIAL